MTLRNFFRRKGSGARNGEKPAAFEEAAVCRGLNEAQNIAEPESTEVLYTGQETTRKLGNKRKGKKQEQHSGSIFII